MKVRSIYCFSLTLATRREAQVTLPMTPLPLLSFLLLLWNFTATLPALPNHHSAVPQDSTGQRRVRRERPGIKPEVRDANAPACAARLPCAVKQQRLAG